MSNILLMCGQRICL